MGLEQQLQVLSSACKYILNIQEELNGRGFLPGLEQLLPFGGPPSLCLQRIVVIAIYIYGHQELLMSLVMELLRNCRRPSSSVSFVHNIRLLLIQQELFLGKFFP
jgi:hypothetical protein